MHAYNYHNFFCQLKLLSVAHVTPQHALLLQCIFTSIGRPHTGTTQSQRSHSSHCHASPRSIMLRIDSICFLLSLIACSVRPLVMPHSATSSARGEDIRTTSS